MSTRQYRNFQGWRKRVKQRLIDAFGGKCGICGYSKCNRNLSFHHVEPDGKDFGIAVSGSKSWSNLVKEARKCVMLCANCHGEVHDNLISIPDDCSRFDERWVDVGTQQKKVFAACKKCGAPIITNGATDYCSIKCMGIARRRRQRASIDEIKKIMQFNNFKWMPSAKHFGISDNALRKWAKAYGLPTSKISKTGTPAWY